MVGYAGSPTYTAYVDMTLTRSNVKVKVTGLLNFRQLAKPCMLAAMTAAPLRGFLVLCMLPVSVARSSDIFTIGRIAYCHRPHRLLPGRGFLPNCKCIIGRERGMGVSEVK